MLIRRLDAGVLTLTLNRPERRNAIDPALRDALADALDEAATDPGIRALIVTGAPGAFCSGGDLDSFDELHDARAYRWRSHRLSAVIESFATIEKPTIAVLDGVAAGAGIALALACDWRIGTPRTRFAYLEGRLGLLATHGGCARLVKLVGLAAAQHVMLGGEELDGEAAQRLGLLNELAGDDGAATAQQRAEKMLARAPLSYGNAKRVLALAADTDAHSAMLAESLAQATLLLSEDHAEGLAAAAERRTPAFSGR